MNDPSWQFEIVRPWALVLLAVVPPAVYYWHRSLVAFARHRRILSLAVHLLLAGVLVGALCGLRVSGRTSRQCVVLVEDISRSIPKAAETQIVAFEQAAKEHADGGRLLRVRFAAEPGPVEAIVGEARAGDGNASVDRSATDIAAAIAHARARMPAEYVPKLVLLTDGNQTTGNALASAQAAGCPISAVPLPGESTDEVYVADVATPGEVRDGEPFWVDVLVRSASRNRGTVKLLRGSQAVDKKDVELEPGENRLRFRQKVVGQKEATFTARLEGFRDTLPENNEAAGVVFFTARPRVLLVASRPEAAKYLAEALVAEHVDVEVRLPAEMPARAEDLQKYDLLILSNVPATSLAEPQMERITSYVRDFGGGLITVGGDRALTPGGYRGTTIEEVLPVVCEAKKGKPKPSLAMVLVLDQSGSMQGDAIELAKQAARQAVGQLGSRDQIGIIAFEDTSRWISEIDSAADKQPVLDRIDTITAGGGTNMYPAIEMGFLALQAAYADLKHMIVLTDGLSHPGDFEKLAREIAASGITVSTVAVGKEAAQQLLKDLADRGGGHFYYCDDPAAVPEIFALETVSAGKVGITEEPFFARAVDADDLLTGIDLDEAPALLGLVETQLKPDSRLVLTSKGDEPLLASWRVGRGTSLVFTSDAEPRWAAAWLGWPEFGPFWARLVRFALRKDPWADCTLRITRNDGRATVTLDAVSPDGESLNQAEGTLKLVGTEGNTRTLPLVKTTRDRCAAEFDAAKQGTYKLEVALAHRGAPVYRQRRALVVGYPDELRVRPTNAALLKSIAEASGGAYHPRPADALAPTDRTVPWDAPLWPYLMAAALLLFLANVTLMRAEWGLRSGCQ